MLDRLGNVQRGFPTAIPGKCPHLRKANGQKGTRGHSGKDGLTKALVASLTLERGHGLPAAVDGLPIVPLEVVRHTQVGARQDGRAAIPASRGQVRARWLDAMAGSYWPTDKKYCARWRETRPSRRGSSRASASVSASWRSQGALDAVRGPCRQCTGHTAHRWPVPAARGVRQMRESRQGLFA